MLISASPEIEAPGRSRPAGPSPRLSAVVPCYDEIDCIGELYARLSAACREVVGIDLSRNHGHQLALTAGLAIAAGERVFIIDADLQDPPELLGAMMRRMDEGIDVVYGQRHRRDGETVFKRVSARLFYRLLDRMTEISIPTDTGDFRLMSRRALELFIIREVIGERAPAAAPVPLGFYHRGTEAVLAGERVAANVGG